MSNNASDITSTTIFSILENVIHKRREQYILCPYNGHYNIQTPTCICSAYTLDPKYGPKEECNNIGALDTNLVSQTLASKMLLK